MIWHVYAASNRLLTTMDPDIKRWMTRWHVMVRYDPSYGGGLYYYAPLVFGWLGWLSDRADRRWRKASIPILRWGEDRGLILKHWNHALILPRKWQFFFSPFGMLNDWAFNTERWWCREVTYTRD